MKKKPLSTTRATRLAPEPELFTRLRLERLLSAYRSLDTRHQQQVVRFAETVALAWTRTVAARNALRRTNVRKLTGWIGGAR
jgi:hypothetical protein